MSGMVFAERSNLETNHRFLNKKLSVFPLLSKAWGGGAAFLEKGKRNA